MTIYMTAAAAVLGAGLLARVPHIDSELTYGQDQAGSAPTTMAATTTTNCPYRATTTALLGTTFSLHGPEPLVATGTRSPTTVETDFVREPQSLTITFSGRGSSSSEDHNESIITTSAELNSYYNTYEPPRSRDYPNGPYNPSPQWPTLAPSGTTTSTATTASGTEQGGSDEQQALEEQQRLQEQQRLDAERRAQRLRELYERSRPPPDTDQFRHTVGRGDYSEDENYHERARRRLFLHAWPRKKPRRTAHTACL